MSNNELKEEYRRLFKRIYPEPEITIVDILMLDHNCIMTVDFPDGIFYFIVDEKTVSNGYKNIDDAKRYSLD